MLAMAYIPGTQKPTEVLHFRGAVEQLCKMHEKGRVQGDFRNVNSVFDNTGGSHLIAFDLARKENDLYPSVSVASHPERHFGAHPGSNMLKIHDKHALFSIIMW